MRVTLPLATALAAMAIAGCGEKSEPEVQAPENPGDVSTTTVKTTTTSGGGSGSQQSGVQQEVNVSIVAVLGGRDPDAACAEFATADYVKRAYGDERGCRAAVDKRGTFSVDVSQVNVKGKTATAKAKPAAGPNKGETISVELVEENGTWKVDKGVSNAPPGP